MIDDVGTIDSEEPDEEKYFLENEKKIVAEQIKTIQERLEKSTADQGVRNIPIKELSDEGMNDDFVLIENEEISKNPIHLYLMMKVTRKPNYMPAKLRV